MLFTRLSRSLFATLIVPLACLLSSPSAHGEEPFRYSPSINGEIGLNTVPSARSGRVGDVTVGVSHDGHYARGFIGTQIHKRLYVGLRQARSASGGFSGADLKLTLFSEEKFRPQIAVGVQSLFGSRRLSAEYLALSKRYHGLDATVGFGWGRFGSRASLPNPLLFHRLGGGKDSRNLDGTGRSSFSDLFSGRMGIFGGVEYQTPVPGLSMKAEFSSDASSAEQAEDPHFHAPSPFSFGLSYTPFAGFNTGVSATPDGNVGLRLTLTPSLLSFPAADNATDETDLIPLLPKRSDKGHRKTDAVDLSDIRETGTEISANLALRDTLSTPEQIGRAARLLSNVAGKRPERITVRLFRNGLRGRDIVLNRTDIEHAELTRRGSNEEIWQNAFFVPPASGEAAAPAPKKQAESFRLDLINTLSPADGAHKNYIRSSLRAEAEIPVHPHFIGFTSLRLSLADNLPDDGTIATADNGILTTHGDENLFARNRLIIGRAFLTGFVTLGESVHLASSFGFIDEFFGGLSNEFLYRPFDKAWAVGLNYDAVNRRDPSLPLGMGLGRALYQSALLTGYYAVPDTGLTVTASTGRYLGGDIGGSVGLSNRFDNGVTVAASMTLTDKTDRDENRHKLNGMTGFRVTLPIGGRAGLPIGSRAVFEVAPVGRNTGQRLDNPASLYDRTEPLSYRALADNWDDIVTR